MGTDSHFTARPVRTLVYSVLFLAETSCRDLQIAIPLSHSITKYLILSREAFFSPKHALSYDSTVNLNSPYAHGWFADTAQKHKVESYTIVLKCYTLKRGFVLHSLEHIPIHGSR